MSLLLEYESRAIVGRYLPLEANNMKVTIGFKGCKRQIDVIDDK
jgi:hypothetical protein